MVKEEYYTIGEVSRILNLSRDMIRYYEKHGVLQSSRDGSNYRRYTAMNIFWLAEAIEHKSWGTEIGDIARVRSEEFEDQSQTALEKRIEEIQKDLNYKKVYLDRLCQVKERMQVCLLNIGNYWVRRISAYYESHFVNGNGDSYERIIIPEELSRFLFNDTVGPFVDSGMNVKSSGQEWIQMINEDTLKKLQLTPPEGMRYVPERLYLCTNIDIGEIGAFQLETAKALVEHASQHHYKIAGDLSALMIARGNEDDRFRRVMELRLPIKA